MLERADRALKVAESSYKAGSVSLIELLESQRTFIETRAQYLRAQHDYRQAVIDVAHSTGKRTQ
jgi:outer membrane protein TolC